MAAISKVAPNTKPILAMLDPSALPIAKSPAPFSEALIDTITSGADVPNDTMVRPITNYATPKDFAIAALPATKRSALQTKPPKPISMAIAARAMGGMVSSMEWETPKANGLWLSSLFVVAAMNSKGCYCVYLID